MRAGGPASAWGRAACWGVAHGGCLAVPSGTQGSSFLGIFMPPLRITGGLRAKGARPALGVAWGAGPSAPTPNPRCMGRSPVEAVGLGARFLTLTWLPTCSAIRRRRLRFSVARPLSLRLLVLFPFPLLSLCSSVSPSACLSLSASHLPQPFCPHAQPPASPLSERKTSHEMGSLSSSGPPN